MKKAKQIPKASASTVSTTNKINLRWMLIIAGVAVLCYGLSVFNNYCLDDFIVIGKNRFTQQGLAGIKDILSHDTFAGMTDGNIMVLAGGRYRPLSLVTFAIEHQIYGDRPFMAHLINVLLYAASCILLFKLLLRFSIGETTAALMAILFAALPAHSEPVINVKGRDDIMCFLFFLMAALQLFNFIKTKNNGSLYSSLLFYFLSLMSKETAVTFVAVFPLMLFCFTKIDLKKIATYAFAFAAMAGVFLLFRWLATKDNAGTVSNDVLNDPFVIASSAQRYATVIYTWLLYLKLMVWPIHLSYDYNFNQIALTTFGNALVWLSVVIHAAMFVAGIYFLKRKPVYAFGLLFYLITFSVFSNLFFNIGAPFADRFIFIPSAGLCIFIIAGMKDGLQKISGGNENHLSKKIALAFFGMAILLFALRTVARCSDWKDNDTLFIADTDDAPNSAKVLLNAGLAYINKAGAATETDKEGFYSKAISHLKKGIAIYPQYPDGYLNIGVIYNWKNDYENAELWWNKAWRIKPDNATVQQYFKILATYYYQQGLKTGAEKNYRLSVNQFLHALQYDSLNADILYNTGGAYFSINKADSAAWYWNKTLQINPNYQQAVQGLAALKRM